jgi:hypothetical protein
LKEENIETNFESNNNNHLVEIFTKLALDLVKNLQNASNILLKEHIEFKYSKIKEFIEDLKDFEAILFHKHIASSQRNAYNNHRKTVNELKNKILIELDFKQKITIGLSPRQVSSEYYNQITRSCLGLFLK